MTYILGLDIGYSNLKIAKGLVDQAPTTLTLPAGAGPLSAMPDAMGAGGPSNFLTVRVAGEEWAAAVEPSRLQMWERDLHPDYPSTPSYRALFLAALASTGVTVVDRLVTGLPVSQAAQKHLRQGLKGRLSGTHAITHGHTVRVDRVDVVPQPVGAFLNYLDHVSDPERLQRSRVLILDPGFFSVDWVVIEGGEIRNALSGSSPFAMSAVFDDAATSITKEHGGNVDREQLEAALRGGHQDILLYGQVVKTTSFIEAAVRRYASSALVALRQSLRSERREIDAILLAGGGALAYKDAAQDAFPKAQLHIADEPVLANARGFWSFAA